MALIRKLEPAWVDLYDYPLVAYVPIDIPDRVLLLQSAGGGIVTLRDDLELSQ